MPTSKPPALSAPPADAEIVTRSSGWLAAYWVLFALTVAASVGAPVVIGSFKDVFRSFGADLPVLTQWVVDHRLALVALPVVVLVPALGFARHETLSRRGHRRYQWGLVAVALSVCGLLAGALFAMYLPVIRMMTVV